jgi:hypothetical protein
MDALRGKMLRGDPLRHESDAMRMGGAFAP